MKWQKPGSSDETSEGYKGHAGEINVAGADNLSFFMYLGEFLKGLTLYKGRYLNMQQDKLTFKYNDVLN